MKKAVEDPDVLHEKESASVKRILIEKNLIIAIPMYRESYLWINTLPSERDLGLGISKLHGKHLYIEKLLEKFLRILLWNRKSNIFN